MINIFQKIVFLQSAAFDFIMYPVRNFSPLTQLLWVSALTGLLMVSIYRLVSKQEEIRKVKRKIKLHFLEINLYRDDIGETLRAQKGVFRANTRYLGLSFVPGTVLVCVVFFILIQLHARFSYRPLKIGEKACVSIKLEENVNRTDVKIILPAGIKLDSPLVFIPSINEFNWRIAAEKEGLYALSFLVKGKHIEKKILVGEQVESVSPKKTQAGWGDFLSFPAQHFIPDSIPAEEIFISLPQRDIEVNNTKAYNWLIIFFPAALCFGLFFKKILGIA